MFSGSTAGYQESIQETRQRQALHPLSIPTDFGDNPFTADPRDEQPSSSSHDMIDVDGVAAGPFHQLNLASTQSSDEWSECSASQRSPRALTLSRSQSELRASPLRKFASQLDTVDRRETVLDLAKF